MVKSCINKVILSYLILVGRIEITKSETARLYCDNNYYNVSLPESGGESIYGQPFKVMA